MDRIPDQTREERIRAKAHALWEKEGRPDGQDGRHWDEAQKLIDEADSVAAGQGPKGPKREAPDR